MREFVLGILCLAKLPNSGTNVRIHVERVIGLLRPKYSALLITLPIDYLLCPDKVRNRCCPMVDRMAVFTLGTLMSSRTLKLSRDGFNV